MKRVILFVMAVAVVLSVFTGCSNSTGSETTKSRETTKSTETTKETEKAKVSNEPIVWAWYPNESGEELKGARDELGKVVEEATGRKVEHKLTTDYIIAIESVVSGNAHIAFFGAEGYVQAHKKNPKVLPMVVNSGSSGTLEDAIYHSWLNVKKGNEGEYMKDGKYSIDNIQGKRFSFVSNSSTSGFRVPSAGIVKHFSQMDKWKDIETEDLLEGGDNNFFKEVLFGGSHQGSAVNLLTGKSDVSAFCDVCVQNYVEFAEGTENTAGATYRVKADAVEPFDTVRGEEYVIISVTPVLNAPFVANTEVLSQEEINSIIEALTSDKTASNEKVFVPKGAEFKGLFKAPERFVKVEDAWFEPIRKLSE
jgi:phosphonate transport system substrate-binding protein